LACGTKEMEGGLKRDDMGAEAMGTSGGNTATGESLGKIVRSAMEDLAQQNREAYDILVSLAEDGTLEEHRTSGELDHLARRLLDTLQSEGAHAD